MISTWHRDFKDFPRITVSDKILYDKVFNITKNSKDDGSQKGLSSMVYELFFLVFFKYLFRFFFFNKKYPKNKITNFTIIPIQQTYIKYVNKTKFK